jgi:hypothetical protein
MPGPEAIPPPRAPFSYPRKERFRFDDADETEGRRLYRALANGHARMSMALARRVSLKNTREASDE